MPVSGYTVHYHGSGCNADHIDSSVTVGNGTTGYNWYLSGEVGKQTLGIFGPKTSTQKSDSITATAMGIAPNIGWHQASCTIFPSLNPWSYCKLSTGRIFANFTNGSAYLRYSDDNGHSWYSVKSLGNLHEIEYVLSTPADEVYAFTFNEGLYYSNDAGQTWLSVNPQAFNGQSVIEAVYTPSGKLLVISLAYAVSISADKGKTWKNTSPTQFVPTNPVQSANGQDGFFSSPAEDAIGNLYVVADESQTIYRSADNGNTWSPLPNDPHGLVYSFYIDRNNWFYKYINDTNNGGVYISKDGGNTYNMLYSSLFSNVTNMSLQSDGNFYETCTSGLITENGSSVNPRVLYGKNTNSFFSHLAYIVAKNNNLIVTDEANLRIMYYQSN